MVTNSKGLFSKQQSFVAENSQINNNDSQYSNLNLNQNLNDSNNVSPVHSYSKSFNAKSFDYVVSESRNEKEKSELWNKSSKTSDFSLLNESKEAKKRLKKVSINNSTLSLHISAYENSNNTFASDSFLNKEGFKKNEQKQTFDSTFVIQNPFEFPRQQNSNGTDPEMSQYSASQRLFNPNKASNNSRSESMSSSDESSSSSSDEAPRNDRPSSHSGISDEEPSSPPPTKTPTLPVKKSSKKSVTPSSSSSSENEEETPKKAKSKSKSSTPSSRSGGETPKKSAPIKSTDTMGSLSPDSSIAPEGSPKIDNEESNVVPDLSDSDDERPKKAKPISSPKETMEDSDDDIVGPRLHFDPDEVEEAEVEQPPIEYDVPLVRGNYGKEPPVLTRWPNFISVDHRPFTEDSYDPEEDINAVDNEGRSRLQLKVENCIRWRNKLDADGNIMKDEEGKEIRESNAKIVRWSDGTMTLNLGAEIYEVTEHKIEEYNQLFLRMRAGLHGNAVFKKRIAFRPLTTDSLTHRKMTMQMAEKTNKSQKVKMIAEVGLDPESSRQSLIRKEEERMRATVRREAQQRKAKERQYRTGLSHGFLEDRDDFDDDPESLSAIKRSFKNNRFDRFDAITRSFKNNRFDRFDAITRRYGHEEEDEDEYDDSRRIERSKIESDDEEDVARKREEKKKRKIVISDEDED